jgi:photosystem II cytochrome c550
MLQSLLRGFVSRFLVLRSRWSRLILVCCLITLTWGMAAPAALAEVDDYVIRYLKASAPVDIKIDAQGNTSSFTPEALTNGKRLFENNCKNCHVGGATLPIPQISLALPTLKGATPPRDNVAALIDFQRQPMVYDGSEETFWCRQVSENWLSHEQLEDLAAFVLRAAEVARGWGTDKLDEF